LRLGILGGTFDPPHFGHLRTAEEVGEFLKLKKVYLLPSKNPPHKKRRRITDFHQRLEMLKLAIEGSDFLDILDIEGKRPGYSYTIDTLREIVSEGYFGKDPEIYFILGIDAFLEIDTWKDYQRLFEYANFVVVKRPGYEDKAIGEILVKLGIRGIGVEDSSSFYLATGKKILFVTVTYMDISSSKIRELVKKGKSISFLLPEKVKNYILEKELYK